MAEPIEAAVVEERTVAALHPAVVEPASALVLPAASEQDIVGAFQAYQALRTKLLNHTDYQTIGGRQFPKKSAWRKLNVAFGVSTKIIDRVYERDEHGRIVRAEVVALATAPNGRSSDGLGACDLYERCCQPGCRKGGRHSHCPGSKGEQCNAGTHFSNAQHDIPSTAETRAKNRASSDLYGFGEVSAEEMHVQHDDTWWGGWASKEEKEETTAPVFEWLRTAPDDAKAASKQWMAEHGIQGTAFPRDVFTEFAAFVASLRKDPPVEPGSSGACAFCTEDPCICAEIGGPGKEAVAG